jgi:hypothetical protein
MPTSRRRDADRRRALKLLAASPDGCTEAIMLAHGFTADMLAELARVGLTTATTERSARCVECSSMTSTARPPCRPAC